MLLFLTNAGGELPGPIAIVTHVAPALYVKSLFLSNSCECTYCCGVCCIYFTLLPCDGVLLQSAMKKIEDNNTLVFIVDKRSNKAQVQCFL